MVAHQGNRPDRLPFSVFLMVSPMMVVEIFTLFRVLRRHAGRWWRLRPCPPAEAIINSLCVFSTCSCMRLRSPISFCRRAPSVHARQFPATIRSFAPALFAQHGAQASASVSTASSPPKIQTACRVVHQGGRCNTVTSVMAFRKSRRKSSTGRNRAPPPFLP